AVWSLDAGYDAKQSVAATSEYGTARANGTWLLELALNMKSPTIYDTIQHGDREERVVNQEATMAAREKQKLIKERFRSWVFTNHLLEQFAREFMQLYPNARLLVAVKEDLTRDRRKMLTAKIASGDWDGIIVTHSSFERIGMSREYQEKFLTQQIAEYDQLL